MIKHLLFAALISLLATPLFAQQLPLFTQYRENISFINPASVNADFTGLSFTPNSSAGISYRYQWSGLKDGPRTMTGRYEHIAEDLNMVFGATVIRDKTGPTGVTGAYLRYAYQLRISRYSFFSLGLSGGFLQSQFNGDEGLLRDPGDYIGATNFYTNYTEFNIGAFYQAELESEDKFYAGVSVPQFAVIPLSNSDDNLSIDKVPHFYGVVGLYKYLGDGWAARYIEPSVWVKYAINTPFQMDMNLRYQIEDIFWVGTGYSVSLLDKLRGNNFHFEAGVSLGSDIDKAIKIGYGFDKSITTYGPDFGSAHEINLTYSFLR